MAGEDASGIWEGEDLRANPGKKEFGIAAREVGPANAPSKEHVAAEEVAADFHEKAEASWAMAGHLEHPKCEAGKRRVGRRGDESGVGHGFDFESEAPIAKELSIRDHRQSVRVAMDFAAVAGADCFGIGGVVEVAVREEEGVDAAVGEVRVRALGGIDQDAAGGGIDQERVRIEGSAGKSFELNHGNVVYTAMRSLILGEPSVTVLSSMRRMMFGKTVWLVALGLAVGMQPTRADVNLDKVAVSVARLLEQGHYSRQKLDDKMSQSLLEQYLKSLDPSKLFFTAADIAEFQQKYATRLDNRILSGDLDPAREIFARYKLRVTDRVAANRPLIQKDYKFDTDATVQLDRQDAEWPRDQSEADQLWAKRIEAELLQETLNDHADIERTPPEIIERRQNQLLRNVEEMDDEAIVSDFLAALARTYDPHSEYMSPSELENFEIQMRLSLEGVGAVLQSEDGYAKVKEIVPGGPADLEGHLAVNDRISAVAQGDDAFEDVVDMKLDKVVEKIRGKRGTVVRLQVIPANTAGGGERKVVTITRDEVSLKDQEAKAEIIDMERPDGTPVRVGWIELPAFYADFDKRGSEGGRSTTKDVLTLLNRLTAENIESLVIDLRQDGGGSLEEAINMTGLFIPEGPVVQSKNSNGEVEVSFDEDSSVAYSGPMVVLMNRLSASASEIFAAALQDYGRAVIVGDEKSFGKGTVQTMLDIGRFMPFFSLGGSEAGALKLTINKFYRVRGGSTQLEGVKSDIVLPSITDNPEIGEEALPNPLPYDEVAPQDIVLRGDVAGMLDRLRENSAERVNKDEEFRYLLGDLARLQEKIDSNAISLNLVQRQAEIDEGNERKDERKAERAERGPVFPAKAYEVTLENVADKKLTSVAFDRKKTRQMFDPDEEDEDEQVFPDAIRNEALRIASDMVELRDEGKTAAIQSDKTSGGQLQD